MRRSTARVVGLRPPKAFSWILYARKGTKISRRIAGGATFPYSLRQRSNSSRRENVRKRLI